MYIIISLFSCFLVCLASRKSFPTSRFTRVGYGKKTARGALLRFMSPRHAAAMSTRTDQWKLSHLLLSSSPARHGVLTPRRSLPTNPVESSKRFCRARHVIMEAYNESQDLDVQAEWDALLKNRVDLQQWREARLNLFGEVLDMSRYHVQVLFVDDDACRARTSEVMLERIADWADMGWWIYASAATIGSAFCDKDDRAKLKVRCADFEFPENRLFAPTEPFYNSYVIDGTYDMIVCTDSEVADKVRASVRQEAETNDVTTDGPPPDEIVLTLSEFLAVGLGHLGEAWAGVLGCSSPFDEQLQKLVDGEAGLGQLSDLPRAHPYQPDEWKSFMAACALASLGMTAYIKQEFDNFFISSYKELLELFYHRVEDIDVTWDECETSLRKHIVTGGLSREERRELLEEHKLNLRKRFSEDLG